MHVVHQYFNFPCFLGAPNSSSFSLSLLIDYISGYSGGSHDHDYQSSIVSVIIAGNLLHRFDKKKTKEYLKEESDVDSVIKPLQHADVLLTQLCASVSTHIMPGVMDPCNYTLPQQRFHPCLFPSASTYSNFYTHTNPAIIDIANTTFMGKQLIQQTRLNIRMYAGHITYWNE